MFRVGKPDCMTYLQRRPVTLRLCHCLIKHAAWRTLVQVKIVVQQEVERYLKPTLDQLYRLQNQPDRQSSPVTLKGCVWRR